MENIFNMEDYILYKTELMSNENTTVKGMEKQNSGNNCLNWDTENLLASP